MALEILNLIQNEALVIELPMEPNPPYNKLLTFKIVHAASDFLEWAIIVVVYKWIKSLKVACIWS